MQRQRPEIARADEVGERLAGRTARNKRIERRCRRGVGRVLGVGVEPGARLAQGVGQQQFGVEARAVAGQALRRRSEAAAQAVGSGVAHASGGGAEVGAVAALVAAALGGALRQ